MNWLSAIKWFLTGNNAKEFTAVIAEWKILKDEYKQTVIEQRKRIEKLEHEVEELKDHERRCHSQLIQANQMIRDLQEELIFIKKMKP